MEVVVPVPAVKVVQFKCSLYFIDVLIEICMGHGF